MSKFKEGTRVLAIVDSKMKRGVISSFYDVLGVAVVQFDDDTVGKVKVSDLAISHEEERREEPKKPTEPVEKSEITITPDKFEEISLNIAVDIGREFGDIVGLTCSIFSAKLHRALFCDGVDNE